ncbi:MAG: sodium:solute symporter [Acidobacteria bacterium]|nr:sodium:solute symporter [Acidobacteriota bacterium]NIM62478.1 sodium:solute symporter [Acidobacteriota bacterium]NIO59036.1 sodium:solute symporter [Acidobacteriota bacterium]NIQ29301.1 sodium:solute symporter [Acidobacteriota bacterium]NIQ86444.1 sodium:solute symporter [Acidobacteriota bacterium]
MSLLDWTIVAGLLVVVVWGALTSRRHMQSVADYLAANRSAGRYLLTLSNGLAGVGAITIVANLEMNYVAGFSMSWWGMSMSVFVLAVTASGWVVYRFRRTRCLTLAEFFERRYSRNFRVFAGIVAFVSGIVNFGIFPAVGARFFIHYCGLPQELVLFGLGVPTFPLTMIVLLAISLWFVFAGGQIAVIVTDFIQGLFVNIAFVAITLYLLSRVGWNRVFEGLALAPENASMINPFKTSHVEDFNFWFFLIGVFGYVYGVMSWQGTQAYNASATSAHEAKMAAVLTNWRGFPQNLLFLFVPIVAFTVMHHADLGSYAGTVTASLEGVETETVRNQLRTPMVLAELLPVGLLGAFAAVMLAAFISTHDTYLHSWGSIFVQDVLLPLRRKPFTPKQHLRALRLSICGVALFIFLFSLLFKQSQYIFLFFAITGAIFAGGSGAVIIGGLYWKRGTTAAAWAAMLTGSGIAVGGIILHQLVDDFWINGQMFWAIAIFGASGVYLVVSLLGPRREFDLEGLFGGEPRPRAPAKRNWILPGIDAGFTSGDRWLYRLTYGWILGWFAVFVVGTVINLLQPASDATWIRFWKVYMWIHIVLAVVVVIWFAIGGAIDLRRMFARLRTLERDPADDGDLRTDGPVS